MKTVFVTLLMIGIGMAMGQGGTGYVTGWDECDPRPLSHKGDHILCAFDGTKWRLIVEPPLVPKPAKPSAKKAEPKPFKCDPTKLQSCASQANDDYGPGRRGLVGEIDWSAPASKYLKAAPPPLDVPAIRKTRVIHPKGTCWGEGQQAVCAMQKDDTEDYWDCKDQDAYSLQVSVSGKAASCHRISP